MTSYTFSCFMTLSMGDACCKKYVIDLLLFFCNSYRCMLLMHLSSAVEGANSTQKYNVLHLFKLSNLCAS